MEKRLMTVDELSSYMGTTKGSLYVMVCHRKIPAQCVVKIGRSLRFDRPKIDIWLDSLSTDKTGYKKRGW